MIVRQIFDIFCALIVIALLTLSSAYAAKSAPDFIRTVSIANQFEISTSRDALQKSQNPDIRNFAQQMVGDHIQARDRLENVLMSSDARLQKPAPGLDAQHERLATKLNSLSGADFDKKYVAIQLDAHKEAVSLFRNYASQGDDPDLKSFAQQMLPVLEGHLQHIREIKKSL